MPSRLLRIVLIITLLLAYTSYKVCQLWSLPVYVATGLTSLLFILMLADMFIHRLNHTAIEKMWFRVLTWIGTLTMGIWSIFIMLSIPLDLIHLLIAVIFNSEKISLIFHIVTQVTFGASILFSLIGFIQVLSGPRVKKVSVKINNLHPSLKTLRIAQVSDLHVGVTIGKAYVKKVVLLANATNPDFIVVTGDLADAKPASIAKQLQPLANLKARLGVFYVTGNHEYYWGVDQWIETVKTLGFIPLLNENRIVQIDSAKVLIAGVTDPTGAAFRENHIPNVYKSVQTEEQAHLKILLAHQPNIYSESEPHGFDLQLSGHTHGGQFFPFNYIVKLAHKYYRGLNRHGNLWLYVNPGTGYWGPANRFGIPSEITLLRFI